MQKKELFQEHLPELVKGITASYRQDDPSISYFKKDLPNRDEIIEIIHLLRQLVFPGFFTHQRLSDNSLEFYAGNLLMKLEEKLKKQIRLALLCGSDVSLEDAIAQAECICIKFFQTFPRLREYIASDVQAAFDGDPAAADKVEVIFCYPGTYAIMVYRFAHELRLLNVPYIPRIMSEYAHNITGIDINPGATIGKYFFIDHGTGVVIGETTVIGETAEIGNNVTIYQGVTLGALSTKGGQMLKDVKRHPTLEDNVVVYSGASILGGETVIGANSVVAGNAFITASVPANTKVGVKAPELRFKDGAGR